MYLLLGEKNDQYFFEGKKIVMFLLGFWRGDFFLFNFFG
jgi:hypothetical protein